LADEEMVEGGIEVADGIYVIVFQRVTCGTGEFGPGSGEEVGGMHGNTKPPLKVCHQIARISSQHLNIA
jgi:hypothetical protein